MKKTILNLLFIFCIYSFSFAQPFSSHKIIDPNTGQEPYEIASGDLDNDGFIDIVMATYDAIGSQDYIKWYKNDGLGNFTIQTTVSSTILWVDGLTVADIDGKFGLDIVATSAKQNKVVYFLSTASGGFGPEIPVDGMITGPGEVVAGDINMDGNIDLAAVSYDDDKTVWYSGDGNGNFVSEMDIENGSTNRPYYMDIGDFDGDTDLDILVGFYDSQTVEIYYNQYIESGAAMTVSWIKDTVKVNNSNSDLRVVSFADVNNDGITDIVTLDNSSGNVFWYNKTKNGPSVENVISNKTIIARPGMVYVVDIDNDMLNDVIVTDSGTANDAIIYFKGASNASPSATPTFITNNNFQLFDITVEDFDGDGDKDIASIGNQNDIVFWLENLLIVLGIPESNIDQISIYPNPTQNKLKFKGLKQASLNASVFNVLGEKILASSVIENGSLDVSSLKSGLYFLKFEENNSTFKFIKQ